jgi:hypothetical protein
MLNATFPFALLPVFTFAALSCVYGMGLIKYKETPVVINLACPRSVDQLAIWCYILQI